MSSQRDTLLPSSGGYPLLPGKFFPYPDQAPEIMPAHQEVSGPPMDEIAMLEAQMAAIARQTTALEQQMRPRAEGPDDEQEVTRPSLPKEGLAMRTSLERVRDELQNNQQNSLEPEVLATLRHVPRIEVNKQPAGNETVEELRKECEQLREKLANAEEEAGTVARRMAEEGQKWVQQVQRVSEQLCKQVALSKEEAKREAARAVQEAVQREEKARRECEDLRSQLIEVLRNTQDSLHSSGDALSMSQRLEGEELRAQLVTSRDAATRAERECERLRERLAAEETQAAHAKAAQAAAAAAAAAAIAGGVSGTVELDKEKNQLQAALQKEKDISADFRRRLMEEQERNREVETQLLDMTRREGNARRELRLLQAAPATPKTNMDVT